MPKDITKVVVVCSEIKDHPEIELFLQQRRLLGTCLVIGVPGGAQAFQSPRHHQEISDRVSKAVTTIVDEACLINHFDCCHYPVYTLRSTDRFCHSGDLRAGASVFMTMMAKIMSGRGQGFTPESITLTCQIVVPDSTPWRFESVD